MSCYVRVEGLSEAMVSLRWIDETGLLFKYLPPREYDMGSSRRMGRPRHLAATVQPAIKIVRRAFNPLLLPLNREFHIPWREFHH